MFAVWAGVVRLVFLGLWLMVGLGVVMIFPFLGSDIRSKTCRIWHSMVLRIAAVDCQFESKDPSPIKGTLLIANHISWLDICVVGSRLPVVFLAGTAISRWPVIGLLVRRGGALFIERGKGAQQAISDIARTLKSGENVAFFPEGKTSNGLQVLKYQPRLFEAAFSANSPVRSISIRYLDEDGDLTSRASYAGGANFVQSVWRIASGPKIRVQVSLSTVIREQDRQGLAKKTQLFAKSWLSSAASRELHINRD